MSGNRLYECGNHEELPDALDECPYCGADKRDESNLRTYETVVVTCPGWDTDE